MERHENTDELVDLQDEEEIIFREIWEEEVKNYEDILKSMTSVVRMNLPIWESKDRIRIENDESIDSETLELMEWENRERCNLVTRQRKGWILILEEHIIYATSNLVRVEDMERKELVTSQTKIRESIIQVESITKSMITKTDQLWKEQQDQFTVLMNRKREHWMNISNQVLENEATERQHYELEVDLSFVSIQRTFLLLRGELLDREAIYKEQMDWFKEIVKTFGEIQNEIMDHFFDDILENEQNNRNSIIRDQDNNWAFLNKLSILDAKDHQIRLQFIGTYLKWINTVLGLHRIIVTENENRTKLTFMAAAGYREMRQSRKWATLEVSFRLSIIVSEALQFKEMQNRYRTWVLEEKDIQQIRQLQRAHRQRIIDNMKQQVRELNILELLVLGEEEQKAREEILSHWVKWVFWCKDNVKMIKDEITERKSIDNLNNKRWTGYSKLQTCIFTEIQTRASIHKESNQGFNNLVYKLKLALVESESKLCRQNLRAIEKLHRSEIQIRRTEVMAYSQEVRNFAKQFKKDKHVLSKSVTQNSERDERNAIINLEIRGRNFLIAKLKLFDSYDSFRNYIIMVEEPTQRRTIHRLIDLQEDEIKLRKSIIKQEKEDFLQFELHDAIVIRRLDINYLISEEKASRALIYQLYFKTIELYRWLAYTSLAEVEHRMDILVHERRTRRLLKLELDETVERNNMYTSIMAKIPAVIIHMSRDRVFHEFLTNANKLFKSSLSKMKQLMLQGVLLEEPLKRSKIQFAAAQTQFYLYKCCIFGVHELSHRHTIIELEQRECIELSETWWGIEAEQISCRTQLKYEEADEWSQLLSLESDAVYRIVTRLQQLQLEEQTRLAEEAEWQRRAEMEEAKRQQKLREEEAVRMRQLKEKQKRERLKAEAKERDEARRREKERQLEIQREKEEADVESSSKQKKARQQAQKEEYLKQRKDGWNTGASAGGTYKPTPPPPQSKPANRPSSHPVTKQDSIKRLVTSPPPRLPPILPTTRTVGGPDMIMYSVDKHQVVPTSSRRNSLNDATKLENNGIPRSLSDIPKNTNKLPHLRGPKDHLAVVTTTPTNDISTVIRLHNEQGVALCRSGRFVEAESLLKKAIDIAMNSDPEIFESEQARLTCITSTLNNLGCLAKQRGDMAQAVNILQQTLEIESRMGPPAPSTLVNLCAALTASGRHSEAIAQSKMVIAMLDELIQEGGDIPGDQRMLVHAWQALATAQSLSNQLNEKSQAESSYVYAVQLAYDVFGPHHPTAVAVLQGYEKFRQRHHPVEPFAQPRVYGDNVGRQSSNVPTPLTVESV